MPLEIDNVVRPISSTRTRREARRHSCTIRCAVIRPPDEALRLARASLRVARASILPIPKHREVLPLTFLMTVTICEELFSLLTLAAIINQYWNPLRHPISWTYPISWACPNRLLPNQHEIRISLNKIQ